MSNKIKEEMNNIEIPAELSKRSKMGIAQAKEEMGSPKRKWQYFVGPVIAASIAVVLFMNPTYLGSNPPANPIVKTINSDYIIDVSEPRKVVGFSENVFIGKVLKQVDTRNTNYPETQFKVEVYENIKGELKGTIIVNQAGGYEGKQLFLMEGDQLLVAGKEYLFATRYLKEENWYTLIPVGGDIAIEDEEHKQEIIEKYKQAYDEEIPFKVKLVN